MMDPVAIAPGSETMQAEQLRELLSEVRAGTRTVDSAVDRLRDLPFED